MLHAACRHCLALEAHGLWDVCLFKEAVSPAWYIYDSLPLCFCSCSASPVPHFTFLQMDLFHTLLVRCPHTSHHHRHASLPDRSSNLMSWTSLSDLYYTLSNVSSMSTSLALISSNVYKSLQFTWEIGHTNSHSFHFLDFCCQCDDNPW